jgi:putative membrane protein
MKSTEEKKPHAPLADDKRGNEYLANERTFLAWIRTAIAIISLGFVVTKFSVWLRELALRLNPQNLPLPSNTGTSLPIGVTLMILGGILAVLAARRYVVVNRMIQRGQASADHGLVILVTVMVAALAIAMTIYMLVTSTKS